jgi:hypothetical protein
MARLETIRYVPHRCRIQDRSVTWSQLQNARTIEGLPQIFWESQQPWREANLWALDRATSIDVDLATVQSSMSCLLAYARWLEHTNTAWWHFPLRKADRCLYRFRKHLIDLRDDGKVAPSSASARMSSVVRFYRWLRNRKLP